jgi:hypothetical protein
MAIVFNQLHPEAVHLLPLRSIKERWSAYLGGEAGVFNFYSNVVALCQEVENRSCELDDDARTSLSCIYAVLFRFAFEEGYCRHLLEGFSPDVANRVMQNEFLSLECRNALSLLAQRFTFKAYDAMARALERIEDAVPPHTSPESSDLACCPAGEPAPQYGPSFESTTEAALLTIVAEDWAHLNELMTLYYDHRKALQFGISSELSFAGMVYQPARGTEIGAASLCQILLFLEMKPEIGRIVLSHGLYDLPEIGVRKSGIVDFMDRRRNRTQGKVIRVFGNVESIPVSLQSLFKENFKSHDVNGYFEVL